MLLFGHCQLRKNPHYCIKRFGDLVIEWMDQIAVSWTPNNMKFMYCIYIMFFMVVHE